VPAPQHNHNHPYRCGRRYGYEYEAAHLPAGIEYLASPLGHSQQPWQRGTVPTKTKDAALKRQPEQRQQQQSPLAAASAVGLDREIGDVETEYGQVVNIPVGRVHVI